MIPKFLLGSNDDYWESFRREVYPKLHPLLVRLGGFGSGAVYENQYVGTVAVDEETLEEELVDAGFERNPIAAYKTHSDGRLSEGSWRLLADSDPIGKVEDDKQLHVTLFRNGNIGNHVDVYAHYEYRWESEPGKHLSEDSFETSVALDMTKTVIDEHTFVKLYNKSER